MTKKSIVIITMVLLTIAAYAWMRNTNMNSLKSINVVDLESIMICNPAECYTITEQSDMRALFTVLQSMELHRDIDFTSKAGFAYVIDLNIKGGEETTISILAKDVRINNKKYAPDENYCDRIEKIFRELSKKYKANLASLPL